MLFRSTIEAAELRFFKDAQDRIQNALRQMGRASNEEVSRTIVESKQALFTRREEIIANVFSNLVTRLQEFRKTDEYGEFIKKKIQQGYVELGEGDIIVQVDDEDKAVVETLKSSLGLTFRISDCPEILGGGCLFVNKTKGRMCDFSINRMLDEERKLFLDRYDLSLEG